MLCYPPPMTSIVDGKSFRNGVTGIAKQAQLNVWIDRRVDPTSPVIAGPVGPTVFAAIGKLAARRDCVLMPVANVLLVGRQDWVDQTASSILSLKIEWQQGTGRHRLGRSDHARRGNSLARLALRSKSNPPCRTTCGRQPLGSRSIDALQSRWCWLNSIACRNRPLRCAICSRLRRPPGSFSRRYSLGKANTIIRDAMRETGSQESSFATRTVGWKRPGVSRPTVPRSRKCLTT